MSGVLVRRATARDLDGVLALLQELADERGEAAPGDRVGSEVVMDEILADRARHLVVAVIDEQAVGTADMLVVANLTHHGEPWAIIENVVVARAARRSGAGREMVEHLIDIARQAGCFKIQVLSRRVYGDARGFYESIGMRPIADGFRLYLED